MSNQDDEFDLDVRLEWALDGHSLRGEDLCIFRAGPAATQEETCAPQATCPANTCGLDCQTQTCPQETCGCNTIETCDQHADSCSPQACGITFGEYCVDETDETCGCVPGGTAGCPDPDPTPVTEGCNLTNLCH